MKKKQKEKLRNEHIEIVQGLKDRLNVLECSLELSDYNLISNRHIDMDIRLMGVVKCIDDYIKAWGTLYRMPSISDTTKERGFQQL